MGEALIEAVLFGGAGLIGLVLSATMLRAIRSDRRAADRQGLDGLLPLLLRADAIHERLRGASQVVATVLAALALAYPPPRPRPVSTGIAWGLILISSLTLAGSIHSWLARRRIAAAARRRTA